MHSANRADYTKYSPSDQSTYYTNAFYCGSCGYNREDLLMIGEGLPSGWITSSRGGQTVDYIAAAIDVIAHEYSHGVTDYTSNLIYSNESGALNEAFSDIMSVGVEFHQQQAGAGPLKADYLEGEDAWRPSQPGSLSGIRSFVRPTDYGHPDHYSNRYLGTSDNGGVHIQLVDRQPRVLPGGRGGQGTGRPGCRSRASARPTATGSRRCSSAGSPR